MPRLLPSVLSRFDLPEAELSAARLDGELTPIGECFGPIDEIEASHHRGASLAALLPPRLIAERRTAAWVLGALERQPLHHELCADTGARYRCIGQPRLIVREVVLAEADITVHGGMPVTSALRTAIDIARTAAAQDHELGILSRLASLGGFDLAGALRELELRRHLPNKRMAAARLTAALGGR